MTSKLVFGVGINDADYVVQPTVNGKRVQCPFYKTWKSVLARVYSEKMKIARPTYSESACFEDWHLFSTFRSWMETQPWENCQLDKDILVKGNKLYSPDTCVFVPSYINNLFLDSKSIRGEYPMGVGWHKSVGSLYSQIRVEGVKKHLGYFTSVAEAHQKWQTAKADALFNAVDKWKLSEDKSYNQDVAKSIIARADKLVYDSAHSNETIDF